MSKFKLFIENFLVYGFGGVISKLIPLIMVPIITRIMPNTMYYGLSDLSNTVTSFASAIAVMGMYDAMYRMFFENDILEYKKSICSTALFFTLFTSILVCCIMIVFQQNIAILFFGDKKYVYLVLLSALAALVSATNSIVSAPTRMQNKRKVYLITNTISSLIAYGFAMPLLLSGHYIIALPLASTIAGVIIEVNFTVMNREWFSIKKVDFNKLKSLLIIALPLFPNFLVYWLFNSCDKVMISNFMGPGAVGIYSVGAKLGMCSQLIYTAFAGGWQYFAFSTMKEKDQIQSNSKVFEYLGVISYVTTVYICAISYWIFDNIFTHQYLDGYIIAPYLFLAPLLQMLFQVACNQFVIIKKTWPNVLILLSGALANVVTNYFFIPILGIEGAAIATLLGYVIADVVVVIVLCKMKLMYISNRFLGSTGLMVVFMVIWRVFFASNCVIGVCLATVFSFLLIYLYMPEIKYVVKYIK